ncbi:MAG: class I SAM-dependent methyltransferase [Telluria sp.]
MSAAVPRRIRHAPAVRALLLQCLAFPLMLATVWLLVRAGLPPSLLGVTLVQGGWAAALSWRAGLASWWRLIQLSFPPVLLLSRQAADALALPPAAFLGVFLFLLLLYWSTFRTQVPYYPSGHAVWEEVARQLPLDRRPLRIVDIGSGLGGLVLDLARRRPDCEVSGIELAPLPWLASRLRSLATRSRARFLLGDYEKLNFGNYEVVFAYLSPAAMESLWRKAEAEMRPGSMLLSYEFAIAGRTPDSSVVTSGNRKILHIWHF